MRVERWILVAAALALLAGGCEKKPQERNWPLHDAAEQGKVHRVQRMIARGSPVDAADDMGCTPLHAAARGGHAEVVDILIAHGARIDALDRRGNTPLMSAAECDRRAVVELLLKSGATMTLPVAAYLGDTDAAGRLLVGGADVNTKELGGKTPLHMAARQGHQAMAEMLISRGADVNAAGTCRRSVLHSAVENGRYETAELLLARGARVNTRDNEESTPLHAATNAGDPNFVELLVRAGAEVNVVDRFGMTPLHIAVESDRRDVVKLLLDAGADTSIRRDRMGPWATPLAAAISRGSLDLIELLLAKTRDIDDHLPLHAAIWAVQHERMMSDCPRSRHDFDMSDDEYEAIRRRAVQGRLIRVLNLLLAHGANVNGRDEDGFTALHWACAWGYCAVADVLLVHGADPNLPAEVGGEFGRYCYTYTDEFVVGPTPLHLAAAEGNAETIHLLFGYGVDIDARDRQGATPLYCALHAGNARTARALMAAGAGKIVVKNDPGETILLDAVRDGDADLVQVLLENGADPNERTAHNETPLDLAIRRGNSDIVPLLKTDDSQRRARREDA